MSDTTLPARHQRSPRGNGWQWLTAWGPVVVFMALIFIFSAQPKTAPPGTEGGVYFSGVMPIFVTGNWDLIVKKTSHMIGYAMLTLLLMRALHYDPDRTPREIAYTALLLALAYALTDELHQAFVAGRTASVLDIGFDYVGAAFASLTGRRVLVRWRDRAA